MKEIIRNLKRIETLIVNVEDEINATERSEFYSVFGSESDRQKDLAKLNVSLKEFLSEKFAILDNLERRIFAEKQDVSNYERKVTILKNQSA